MAGWAAAWAGIAGKAKFHEASDLGRHVNCKPAFKHSPAAMEYCWHLKASAGSRLLTLVPQKSAALMAWQFFCLWGHSRRPQPRGGDIRRADCAQWGGRDTSQIPGACSGFSAASDEQASLFPDSFEADAFWAASYLSVKPSSCLLLSNCGRYPY